MKWVSIIMTDTSNKSNQNTLKTLKLNGEINHLINATYGDNENLISALKRMKENFCLDLMRRCNPLIIN
jgi:hypothetical protein